MWMKTNFDRHYYGNRAPFPVFMHAAWFWIRDSHLPAYKRFVDYMNSLPDVYLVSVSQAVEYTRNPKPVSGGVAVPPQRPNVDEDEESQLRVTNRAAQILDSCQKRPEHDCHPHLCQLRKQTTNEERWMTSCVRCPAFYPWLDNPLGLDIPKEED